MAVEKAIKLNFQQIMFQNICAVYTQIHTVLWNTNFLHENVLNPFYNID